MEMGAAGFFAEECSWETAGWDHARPADLGGPPLGAKERV